MYWLKKHQWLQHISNKRKFQEKVETSFLVESGAALRSEHLQMAHVHTSATISYR